MDGLIDYLAVMYGARFVDAYRGTSPEALRAVWRHELQGYTGEELQRGLTGCRLLKFPPTLPEFLALCRPPIDCEAAFYEAGQQLARRSADGSDVWSHPAVYHAAVALSFELRQGMPYAALRTRWAVALTQAERDIESGRLPAEVPPRPPLLAAKPEPFDAGRPIPPGIRERIAALVGRIGRPSTRDDEGKSHAA